MNQYLLGGKPWEIGASMSLIEQFGGNKVDEVNGLGFIVQCREDVAEVLDLIPIVGVHE